MKYKVARPFPGFSSVDFSSRGFILSPIAFLFITLSTTICRMLVSVARSSSSATTCGWNVTEREKALIVQISGDCLIARDIVTKLPVALESVDRDPKDTFVDKDFRNGEQRVVLGWNQEYRRESWVL